MVCFSEYKDLPAPRRLTQEDIRATFRRRWRVHSIVSSRYEVRDGSTADNAWLAIVSPV